MTYCWMTNAYITEPRAPPLIATHINNCDGYLWARRSSSLNFSVLFGYLNNDYAVFSKDNKLEKEEMKEGGGGGEKE